MEHQVPAMVDIQLQEYGSPKPYLLTVQQRDRLMQLVTDIDIRPAPGQQDVYLLQAGSTIGAVTSRDLSITIVPKIKIERVLFLISYALDPKRWQKQDHQFEHADSIVEAVTLSLVFQLKRALRRGLLQGYRVMEESLATVRGRIALSSHIGRRFGAAPPIDVVYDDFTEDILENRILKAAIGRAAKLPVRSEFVRRQIRHYEYLLSHVTSCEFPAKDLPDIHYSRLNEHYRGAVELAKLILAWSSTELDGGAVTASSFLVDMNEVFETFVAVALREALQLSGHQFCRQAVGHKLRLDAAGKIALLPDLSWWDQGVCVFVGDVKYKRVNVAGIKHQDIYQMLAYATALQLESGLLIYAEGQSEPAVHEVMFASKRLEVATLDVSGEPLQILDSVRKLAGRVRQQRQINEGIEVRIERHENPAA
jgi:5-methylcytosine-specific restriction enzyme subunit McrC